MEKISKPHIVEFLRLCDRNHWLHPRIRYASIRSKPQLLSDVKKHYRSRRKGTLLLFHPTHHLPAVPKISYDFARKRFLYDGKPIALPIRSQTDSLPHRARTGRRGLPDADRKSSGSRSWLRHTKRR